MDSNNHFERKPLKRKLPIAKNEDVEFAEAQADEEDREALDRANTANNRQENH